MAEVVETVRRLERALAALHAGAGQQVERSARQAASQVVAQIQACELLSGACGPEDLERVQTGLAAHAGRLHVMETAQREMHALLQVGASAARQGHGLCYTRLQTCTRASMHQRFTHLRLTARRSCACQDARESIARWRARW